MPLLGAIGNASEYSFRGTYDNYPFDIDFGDLIDAEPGQIYTTLLKFVEDINYKVPISITGDGEYLIGNISSDKTFDNDKITLDQTATTFDATFLELDYSTQPTYVRNGNTVGLRIFGILPKVLENDLTVVNRSSTEYSISLSGNIAIGLRTGDYTFSPNNSIQFDNRTFQGDEVGVEYYDKTYSTTITIGKKEFTWTVVTKKAEQAQNFSFSNITDVDYSSEIISDTYTVQGLTDSFDYTADITSNEGLVSVNYGDFVTSSTVKNGDILRLKLTSSSLNATTKNATVRIALSEDSTVGSISTTWSVATLDSVPSNLSFTDIPSVELNAEILSEIVTIAGLSGGIDFNISITSTDGLLSVNGSSFVKSTTIKNGDQLQLRVDASSVWLEEKNVVVKLANTSTTWNAKNRNIIANSDSNASSLIYALPFNTANQVQDMSPEVRQRSSLSAGLRASSFITTVAGRSQPSISTDQSKYYGNTGSLKLAKGSTTKTFETTIVRINTDSTQSLGFSDFTVEMWMRFSGFNFGGEAGMSVFYPSYIDSRNLNDYFFQLFVKGDNWINSSNFKRGLLLGYPDANGVIQTICETTYQVFGVNTWNHIALTRSGSTFRIWVNGSNVTSGSRSMDLTSTGYNFAIPNFQRLTPDDVHIQDLRLYKGFAKYTSQFNTANVTSIMEKYNQPLGDFYIDPAGRILILSCATPLKDPRTLSKIKGAVLPGTDTCIDDTRWQEFLSLAQSTSGYRLAVTQDQSTTKITNAATDNIQRMLNANALTLRNSLTGWVDSNYGYTLLALAWDETSGDGMSGYGSDYSILSWSPITAYGFGYYGQSSNPFFTNPEIEYSYQTANWWILPPGVPDF